MKTLYTQLLGVLASIFSILMVPAIVNAQNYYYMTANDAANTSSFNNAGSWNINGAPSGAAPVPGNTYATQGWLMRSPASGGSYLGGTNIFAGGTLIIGGTNTASQPFSGSAANNNCLIFKVSGLRLVVTNLIMDGGAVRDGNGNGNFTFLDGNITVTTNGGAFLAQDTNFVDSAISGPGPLYIGDNGNGSTQRVIVITSGKSTYTGNIILNPAAGAGPTRSRLIFAPGSIMNFTVGANGVNNNIFGTGTVQFNANWNIDLSGADNTVGDAWTLVTTTNTVMTYGPTFNINGFTQNAGNANLWDYLTNGIDYEYDETSGVLSAISAGIIFTREPGSQAVAPGNQASLSVSASGPGTLDYQWYFLTATDTNAISGATNTSYSTTATSALGVTNYFVVVANGITPPATSVLASVTVRTPNNLEWSGTGSSWDTASLNWTANGNVSQTTYTEADDAQFDNLGAAQPTAILAQTLHPTLVTVAGSTSYTLSGPGAIAGPGAVVMSGSGILLMDNTNNSYSGGTLVSSGTLQIGDGTISSSLGIGPVTNNSAIVAMPGTAANETIGGSISGTGTLSLSSAGDLVLSASNSVTGGVTANNGRILTQNPNALGTGSVQVNSGGQIYLLGNSGTISASAMTLNGAGTSGSVGALRKGNQTTSTFAGTVTLASSSTLNVDGSGAVLNLTSASGINGAGANANLTLAGAGAGNIDGPLSLGSGGLILSGGTWTVGPNNNFTGLTAINGGGLFITGPLSLGPVPASFNASDVTLNGGTLGTSTNVVLDDGNIGITVSDVANTSRITVNNTNTTFVISNNISGDTGAVLTKTGSGTLVLQGPNTYAGALNLDSASSSANDGTTVIADNGAIANMLAAAGFPYITIANNNGGSSTLGLDGTSGSITVAPDISLAGRNVAVKAIENIAGNNTISGNITLVVGGTNYIFQADTGTLTLTAPLPYTTPTSSGRTFTFQGPGNIVVSGGIQDGANNGTSNVWDGVLQNGPGLLTISAPNSYSGTTVVSNGVLSVTASLNSLAGVTVDGGLLVDDSSISGPVAVAPGGSIEAGTTNSIGTLTLASTLSLSGNTIVKINKSTSGSDLFSGQTGVTYGGTLTVTNLAGTLALGDHFTLFSPGTSASTFTTILGPPPGPGLAYSFANGVLSVVNGPATNPTPITFQVNGNVLTLSWPADHLGWTLETQTNSLSKGLGTSWVRVPGSVSVTSTNITMSPSAPVVFYRLVYP